MAAITRTSAGFDAPSGGALEGSDPARSPPGCVIVLDGREIAAERNQTKELPDATAHAEMMAVRRACEATGELKLRDETL